MDPITEFQWLEMAISDDTVDSPFWPSFGQLTHLLSKETSHLQNAQQLNREIKTLRVPVEGTSWTQIETTHPTEDVMDILVQLKSQASEGIACALIITLANDLRSLSKLFSKVKLSRHKICDVGPIIGGVRWADLVYAASNYVRHSDEWSECAIKEKGPDSFQKNSVEPLINSGLNVWTNNPSFLDVAKHLKIDQWKTLFNHLSDWLSECMRSHSDAP